MRSAAIALMALLGLSVCPLSVRAAESYANCTGTITKLPIIIGTPGTWCLKSNLSTAATSGNAINISNNNVTIDCNDFVLASTAGAAGNGSGIFTQGAYNATVRHCNIRGFKYGVNLQAFASGGGNLVEDNHFDGNTYTAIRVEGDGSVVRHNDILNTGGTSTTDTVWGIYTIKTVVIQDNTINGLAARVGSNGSAYGIHTVSDSNGIIDNNRVRGLAKDGTGRIYGIHNSSASRISLTNNDVFGDSSPNSKGLFCNVAPSRARNNVVGGFAADLYGCGDAGLNDLGP